jgi:hypothetical protein
VVWEWQVWRCISDIRDIFEENGWKSRSSERNGDEVMPVLAQSGGYCLVFFKKDSGTGECWFELRDMVRSRRVFVHGMHNIPTPERAAELLTSDGGPLYQIANSGDCSMYGLPVVPGAEAKRMDNRSSKASVQ